MSVDNENLKNSRNLIKIFMKVARKKFTLRVLHRKPKTKKENQTNIPILIKLSLMQQKLSKPNQLLPI